MIRKLANFQNIQLAWLIRWTITGAASGEQSHQAADAVK
jgi:hypothetical protein